MNLKAEWVMMIASQVAVAAREEPRPLVLGEVGLVRNKDVGGWIERQELSGGLCKAMSWHDLHGFGDQAQTLLLHDRGGHRHGFPAPTACAR